MNYCYVCLYYGGIVARYGSEEKYFEVQRSRYELYYRIGREKIYPLLYGKAYE
jgi:hypothetical protein